MNKLSLLSLMLLSFLFIQCKKEINTDFLIGNTSFANLTTDNSINDLESVFATDSVVLDKKAILLGSNAKNYTVYENGGNKLFSATNSKEDSLKIKTIRVLDGRYITSEGIGLNSTFGEITKKYSVKKILTTRQNIIVTLNENNLYFTISREELPSNLHASEKIEIANIPDAAKIKYLMLDW